MKTHKTIREKVITANRSNAKKSTGPKTVVGKLAVRHNAIRHGLLAKQILFRHGEVRQQEFKQFLDELEHDLKPIGLIERMLVEEAGACWWKLGTANKLELQEFRNHRNTSKQVIAELHGAGSDLNLFDKESNTGTLPTWGCDRLVVRRSTGTTEIEAKSADKTAFMPAASSNQERGCLEIQASLTSFLPTILRYEAGLKRDYYRAVNTLLELQRRRKEGEKKKTK
jgi:hypothetical protein